MKKCFKCGAEKDLTEFYKHPKTKDGRVGKCKSCNKADVTANRNKNIDKCRAYDRARGNRQSPEYIRSVRAKNPTQYKAQTMVNNAIRDKRLHKEPCEICGTEYNIHAHHDDYAKPLNVRWLCAAHHKQWHSKNGEGKNS